MTIKRFLNFDAQTTGAANLADANAFIASINTILGLPSGNTTSYANAYPYTGTTYRVEIKDPVYNMLTSAQKAKTYEDFPNLIKAPNLIVPANWQGYQRNSSNQADIKLIGSYGGTNSTAIEGNFSPNGTAYSSVSSGLGYGPISNAALAAQPLGQGTVTLRPVADPTASIAYTNVLISDFFGLIGQSNMGEQGSQQVSSGKALIFNKSTRRSRWSTMDGTDGITLAGWPTFCNSYANSQGRQCGMVQTAIGGTRVEEWQKTSTYSYAADPNNPFGVGMNLYNRNLALTQLAGCGWPKLWLWHQGEANVAPSGDPSGTSKADYKNYLRQLANDLFADTGVKLMAAKMEQTKGQDGVPRDNTMVNGAIGELWAEGGNVVQGPDFSDVTPSQNQVGFGYVHFVTNAETQLQWSRWWTAVQNYFSFA